MKKIISSLALLLMATSAMASDRLELGEPSYGGTGCPAGSASVTLSPDQQALSILFDEYASEAGGEGGKRLDRKSCNVAIPVHVPQGFSVSLFSVDYRGYAYVPNGGEARFNVEYFFAGRRGPRYTKSFRGPMDNDYLIENDLQGTALVWSACGADTILRANTSMLAKTNRRKQEVLATVDSADVEAGIIYHIRWKRCRD
ncbi:MAG: DUF4360 domain-containing protein [Bdellovibrionales bacterium]|nr:DUF4360 domain-containing protein [Bdellovibrionales bacterium]